MINVDRTVRSITRRLKKRLDEEDVGGSGSGSSHDHTNLAILEKLTLDTNANIVYESIPLENIIDQEDW